MKTESYKWWEEVQSKLHQNFDSVRLSATHILWLSENIPPTKCKQSDSVKSVCASCDKEKQTHEVCMDCITKMIKENKQTVL